MECRICPRGCGVDRSKGARGFCGETDGIRVARAALHFWEEPCISGKNGSGTVFFSGCPLRCVYCQNREIAHGHSGKEISMERLAEIFLHLQEQGANNINLVTPTHFVPQIVKALERAKAQGLRLPIVYNTGSYECVETLQRLEGLVDIYLPDLKYVDNRLGLRYSQAADYFAVASRAIAEMVRQVGEARFYGETECQVGEAWFGGETARQVGEARFYEEAAHQEDEDPVEDELMSRGVIVRHLVLPGCSEDSKAVVRYLYETYGDGIYISIMNQFTPLADPDRYPELGRKVTSEEYDAVVDYAIELGVEHGFIQEGDTARESFIPAFDLEGV